MTNTVSLRSRFQGAMLGVAIGDGMGMGVETMKHEEIMKLNGGQGVVGFMAPVQKRFPEIADYPPAHTTDDWQLTAAVAYSLIRCGGKFSQWDCAQAHMDEWKIDHSTWGKSTRTAIQEIVEGKRHFGEPPQVIPGKTGLGNGVMMKVTPLALTYYLRQHESSTNCLLLGEITHGDKRASVAAYAVMRLMHTILQNEVIEELTDKKVSSLLGWLVWEARSMERGNPQENVDPADQISSRLERVFPCLGEASYVRKNLGCGFTALETAPFAIATFLRHSTDFRNGILEAVNAGEDTDTNASVVGALIGANVGIEGIPEEWVNQCPVKDWAIELADSLYARSQR